MAKQTLPTNFKDDVLNTSMGGKRKWNITQNSDGTYSITDVTDYSQVGSEFGAGELNATNQAVNESADAGKIIDDIDTISALTEEGYMAGGLALKAVTDSLGGLQFGVDENGNYGYIKAGADSVTPFSGSEEIYTANCYRGDSANSVSTLSVTHGNNLYSRTLPYNSSSTLSVQGNYVSVSFKPSTYTVTLTALVNVSIKYSQSSNGEFDKDTMTEKTLNVGETHTLTFSSSSNAMFIVSKL